VTIYCHRTTGFCLSHKCSHAEFSVLIFTDHVSCVKSCVMGAKQPISIHWGTTVVMQPTWFN